MKNKSIVKISVVITALSAFAAISAQKTPRNLTITNNGPQSGSVYVRCNFPMDQFMQMESWYDLGPTPAHKTVTYNNIPKNVRTCTVVQYIQGKTEMPVTKNFDYAPEKQYEITGQDLDFTITSK